MKKGIIILLGTLILNLGVAHAATASFQHNNSSGGKGVDTVSLSAPGSCMVFRSARLEFSKRRYGSARISRLPAAGCNPGREQCTLAVEWEHGPAGGLDYQVVADWSSGGC
ncbi:MAG: hypothetical protein KDI44_00240 [Thiothrix sp.]|nr:hypothetical protein [Thiothrix sp.]HPQ95383.1 hypothetical protein [Thiolinea sp.]